MLPWQSGTRGPAWQSVLLVGLVLQLAVGSAQAKILGGYFQDENKECVKALEMAYSGFGWLGPGYPKTTCTNPNYAVSMYSAMYTYCSAKQQAGGMKYWTNKCTSAGKTLLSAESLAANLTPTAIAQLPVRAKKAVKAKSNVTAPFLIDKAWYTTVFHTEHDYDHATREGVSFGFSQYGFWGTVLVFGMGQNLIRKVVDSRRGYVYTDAEGHGRLPTGRPTGLLRTPYAFVRKHIMTPSLLPPYHQQRFFGCTIPTRIESFVVYSYWIVSAVLMGVNYLTWSDNQYYATTTIELTTYVAQRTGLMSYANIPLIWMFSGRNNVFQWLTGWQFGTFNIFHRHIARIATLEGFIHAVCYTINYVHRKRYILSFKKLWFALGVAGMVVMAFIILFSFSFFRVRMYDSFLIVHIVLSALLLVFLYYHTTHYDLTKFNYPFLMPAIAIWSIDRLLRLVRQAYCNIYVGLRRGKTLQYTKSTVTYDRHGNILLFEIVPGNRHMFMGPGQHYYLYQPLRFWGWQNHPFTLADWTQPDGPDGDVHLHFWVRPYDGWTKQMRQACVKRGRLEGGGQHNGLSSTLTTGLLLEGPYGRSEPVHTFEELLFVAGGTGIAAVIPYIRDYLRRREPDASGRLRTRTRHVTLLWADRSEAHIRHTASVGLRDIVRRSDVEIELYLTGERLEGSSASSTSGDDTTPTPTTPTTPTTLTTLTTEGETKKISEKTVQEKPTGATGGSGLQHVLVDEGVHMHIGRPDVVAAVQAAAATVYGTSSRLAVMVCGPGQLADRTRQAVAQSMENGVDSIEIFEETFGW